MNYENKNIPKGQKHGNKYKYILLNFKLTMKRQAKKVYDKQYYGIILF
jgi:hypothetical protein